MDTHTNRHTDSENKKTRNAKHRRRFNNGVKCIICINFGNDKFITLIISNLLLRRLPHEACKKESKRKTAGTAENSARQQSTLGVSINI